MPRRLAALRRRKPKEQEEAAAKEEPRQVLGTLEADLVKLAGCGWRFEGVSRNLQGIGYDVKCCWEIPF